jgi:hypothetical protein
MRRVGDRRRGGGGAGCDAKRTCGCLREVTTAGDSGASSSSLSSLPLLGPLSSSPSSSSASTSLSWDTAAARSSFESSLSLPPSSSVATTSAMRACGMCAVTRQPAADASPSQRSTAARSSSPAAAAPQLRVGGASSRSLTKRVRSCDILNSADLSVPFASWERTCTCRTTSSGGGPCGWVPHYWLVGVPAPGGGLPALPTHPTPPRPRRRWAPRRPRWRVPAAGPRRLPWAPAPAAAGVPAVR